MVARESKSASPRGSPRTTPHETRSGRSILDALKGSPLRSTSAGAPPEEGPLIEPPLRQQELVDALCLACREGEGKVVRKLLSHATEGPALKPGKKVKPLSKKKQAAKDAKDAATVRKIMRGVDTDEGMSCFDHAAVHGDQLVVKALIEAIVNL